MENKNKDLGVIEVLKLGFLRCGFISLEPQAIADLIMRKIEENMSHLFKHRVIKVEVEKDDNKYKVTLTFENEEKVETTWQFIDSIAKEKRAFEPGCHSKYHNVLNIS